MVAVHARAARNGAEELSALAEHESGRARGRAAEFPGVSPPAARGAPARAPSAAAMAKFARGSAAATAAGIRPLPLIAAGSPRPNHSALPTLRTVAATAAPARA